MEGVINDIQTYSRVYNRKLSKILTAGGVPISSVFVSQLHGIRFSPASYI